MTYACCGCISAVYGRRSDRCSRRNVHLVPTIWLLPIVAFGVLTVVGAISIRRLVCELRVTAESLATVAEAIAAVRADVIRARAAIDALDVPSLRQATSERVLGMAVRWAARRVLPF